jgi:hypothetical protein
MRGSEAESDRLWARRDLVRLPGTVTRVGKTFVSIRLPPPYGLQSVPWSGPQVGAGARVTVAGETVGSPPLVGFRTLVVQVRGFFRSSLVAIPQPSVAAIPTSPQPWIEVLVRHGLLDAPSQVRPELYGCSPVGVLLAVHQPLAARERGFVHYDHRWGNDTDDLIGDLAAIVGCPESFTQQKMTRDEISFEVRSPNRGIVADRVDAFDGDLGVVADRMNRWVSELGAERRIFTLETGMDRWAFLGRTPRELEVMGEQGLPLDDFIPAPPKAPEDWSDVI